MEGFVIGTQKVSNAKLKLLIAYFVTVRLVIYSMPLLLFLLFGLLQV